MLDSLRLARWIPPGPRRAIDLGSGAGLPGLVLAIATGISFDLVEADRRKAAFLREAAAATGAPATVHCERIEASALPPATLITARALAPLPALLALATPLLQTGGTLLFPKGVRAAEEIALAQRDWRFHVETLDDPATPVLRITEPARA